MEGYRYKFCLLWRQDIYLFESVWNSYDIVLVLKYLGIVSTRIRLLFTTFILKTVIILILWVVWHLFYQSYFFMKTDKLTNKDTVYYVHWFVVVLLVVYSQLQLIDFIAGDELINHTVIIWTWNYLEWL